MTTRTISFDHVVECAEALCGKAACDLPPDVLARIGEFEKCETTEHGKEFFRQYL